MRIDPPTDLVYPPNGVNPPDHAMLGEDGRQTATSRGSLNGTPPSDGGAGAREKRSGIVGGLATREFLDSSASVLSPSRGASGTVKGGQQFFTPREIADLVAATIGREVPTIDTTAGAGSMLAGFSPGARYGIEIDLDHEKTKDYKNLTGDAQKAVPMLRAAEIRFPGVAINPPYGLDDWRDPAHGKGRINSTVLAFLWALDLMLGTGQGAILCGTSRLKREVLALPESRGVYAVVEIKGGAVWPTVTEPVSVAFFVAPGNVKRIPEIEKHRRLKLEVATLAEASSGATVRAVRDAREGYANFVATYLYDDVKNRINEGFFAVKHEYKKRKDAQDSSRRRAEHDLTLRGKKIHSKPSPYARILLAKNRENRSVEHLHNQNVNYFAQNVRSWRRVEELVKEGVLTVSPALESAAAAVIAEAEISMTPLFGLKPQMRLGWLQELDKIRCIKTDTEKGFFAGESYGLATRSVTESVKEERLQDNRKGEPELRQFTIERRLLQVEVQRENGGTLRFNESPENIRYLIDHFDVPDPGDVASRFPEAVRKTREVLSAIERDNGFSLKDFQKDHLARLLTKKRGLLAHEQGLGKTLMLMTLAEAAIRSGAENKALFVAPQDLIPQWQREAKRFFGRELEEIRTPEKAREVARRLKAGGTGWFITYYECLSIVGRKTETLPHVRLNRHDELMERLRVFKDLKAQKKAEGIEWNVGAIRAPEPPKEGKPKSKAQKLKEVPSSRRWMVEDYIEDDDAATSRWACPKCKTDTAHGWTGEVCRNGPNGEGGIWHGCGYVHRKIRRKSAAAFLTKAFIDGVICVDELSEIRGDDSLRSKAIRALSRGQWKFGGTGTPLSNYINDAYWGLWWTLGNGSAAFPYNYREGKTRFEEDFAVIEYLMGKDEKAHTRQRRTVLPKVTNVSQFWRLTQPSVSRCRKEQTGEPLVERTYHPISVPLGVAQKQAQDFWIQNFANYFTEMNPDHPLVEAGLVERFEAALGLGWRMEFASTMPTADEPTKTWHEATGQDWYADLSPWTPATLKVLELAAEHAERGEKVLIGSDLIAPGYWMAEQLNAKGIRAVHLTEEKTHPSGVTKISTKNPRKRADEVQQFTQGAAQVMCAGINAMKLGHNMDVASTVIVHGLPYSHMVMDQFIARVHRLTSKKPVSVYVVIPKGTIAQEKWQLLKDKAGASDLAFDGELVHQKEEQTDLATMLKAMKARGIRPTGDEIPEADVEKMWNDRSFDVRQAAVTLLPAPKAHPSGVTKAAGGLLSRLTAPGLGSPQVTGYEPPTKLPAQEEREERARKREEAKRWKPKKAGQAEGLFAMSTDGEIEYSQASLF